jgi:hypothetical protein
MLDNALASDNIELKDNSYEGAEPDKKVISRSPFLSHGSRLEITEVDMARIGSAYLDTDDIFPKLEFQLVTGEKLKLPEGMDQGYGVVLIYRGEW